MRPPLSISIEVLHSIASQRPSPLLLTNKKMMMTKRKKNDEDDDKDNFIGNLRHFHFLIEY